MELVGSIPIPDDRLDYPLGIKNYKELFGTDFDLESYKKITFDYYVGSLECETPSLNRVDENGNLAPMHDMSYFDRSVPTIVGKKQRELFGINMFERAKKTIDTLKNMGIKVEHTIIPNVAHNQREATEIIKKHPAYKKVEGINCIQGKIISSSFERLLQGKSLDKEESRTKE